MSGLRRSLARGGAQNLVPLSRQGGGRAPRAAFAAGGEKGKEGTPLPDESFSLEPGGSGAPSVVAMTMRLSEEVNAALLNAQKGGLAVQLKFGSNPQSHILKIGEQEYLFASTDEGPKNFDSYVEKKGAEAGSRRLVEIGPVVKKLNLQRSLTAAVASKVKQRSDAAEKQLKSRKAIVLEHDSAGQAAPPPKKVTGSVRKTTLKDKLLPPPKKAEVSGLPKPPQQTPSRSQSPAPTTQPTQQPPGPSRLAVSSPPTEAQVTAVSPAANTGPSSKSSAPAEEGGPNKGVKVPPAKPKWQATNQELRTAIVSALAGAAENKMRPKSVEKGVQESLPDAGYGKPQFDRLLRSVAAFIAPGFWHLNPDVLKAFNEGRIMNTTSPETVAADSPALNLESPPLVTSPPIETETIETAAEKIEETAASSPAVENEAKQGSLEEASKDAEGTSTKGEEARTGTGQQEISNERKEQNEASSSDSGSSSSDSSSGSSGSSSSDEEEVQNEVQSSGEERKVEELGATANDLRKEGESQAGDLQEEKKEDLQRERANVMVEDGKMRETGVEDTGVVKERGGFKPTVEIEPIDEGPKPTVEIERRDDGPKPTVQIERIDEGPKSAVEIEQIDEGPAQNLDRDGEAAEKTRIERSATEKDASSLKRKEDGREEGSKVVPKKRKMENEAQGPEGKIGALQNDGSKTDGEKSVTGSKKQKVEKRPGEEKNAKAEGPKGKKPADKVKDDKREIVNKLSKPEEIVNERQASHAAASPSGAEDTRTTKALSIFKAAQDKIAEKKASRKAIAIDVQDQTVLDRRKEGGKKVVKKSGLGKHASGKSGLVKPASVKTGPAPEKSGSVKPAPGKSNVLKPMARVQVEKLDEEGDSGPEKPAKRSPQNVEKRKREEETEGAKAKEPGRGVGNGFGKSPLEDGELVPTPKKSKLGPKKTPLDTLQRPQPESGGQNGKPKLVVKPQAPQKVQKESNKKDAVSNGVAKKKVVLKPVQKDSSKPAQSGLQSGVKSNGTKVLTKVSVNEYGVQNGKGKGDSVKKQLNKTRTVSEQDWVKYADAEPSTEPPTISSREQYDAAFADYMQRWPVYEHLRKVLEEHRQRFLAYDEKIAAARKTHNEQQQRELGLELSVEYSRIRKVHKRMRKAISTLHQDLSALKPRIVAYAAEHGLQFGGQ